MYVRHLEQGLATEPREGLSAFYSVSPHGLCVWGPHGGDEGTFREEKPPLKNLRTKRNRSRYTWMDEIKAKPEVPGS